MVVFLDLRCLKVEKQLCYALLNWQILVLFGRWMWLGIPEYPLLFNCAKKRIA